MYKDDDEMKWSDQSTKALDQARYLDSGLWHLEQLSRFIKSPTEAVADYHQPLEDSVLYTTNIPASEGSKPDYFKVLVSDRGHVKVFGEGNALAFSSVFNKSGTRKAIDMLTEGARKAGMIPKNSPKIVF